MPRNGKMWLVVKIKNQPIGTSYEKTQMLKLSNKNFKAELINIHNDLKGNVIIKNEKMGNLSKEM